MQAEARTRDPAGDGLDSLAAIAQPDVSLRIYRRRLPAAVRRALADWARSSEPSFDRVGGDLEPAFEGLHGAARAWLRADVAALLAHFTALTGPLARVSLRAIRSDACRKFHTDYLRMRLITTYVGPGTEWLPEHAVRRAALADPPSCPQQANRAIVRDRALIRRARAGDVLLMKGARSHHEVSTVHRSPPIESTGVTRLVLTLSTVDG